MSWWKQLILSLVVAVAALVAWIAWVPDARPMLERVGVWSLLDRSGALEALAAVGIVPAQAPEQGRPGGGFGGFGGAPMVTVADVVAAEAGDTVTSIGTGQALRSVAVTPETSGRLVEVRVQPGQRVEAGMLLARLDDASQRIAADRARLLVEDARATAERFRRLQGTGAATEVQIRDAELSLRTAELALDEAELDLRRRSITAPIAGHVGFVEVEVGDQIGPQTEITRIDDRSVLLVEFLVPERHIARIDKGMALVARPLARPTQTLDGRVRAIDSRVDPVSRSLNVQAELENPGDALRAGMAFSIELAFPGDILPAVDALAIQWSRSGAFVWALREGRSERVPVRIVRRAGDVVLVDAALEPGEQVIREGVQMLRPGLEVQLGGAGGQADAQAAGQAGGRPAGAGTQADTAGAPRVAREAGGTPPATAPRPGG
jgi:RND family efflux transporter MFP subunit